MGYHIKEVDLWMEIMDETHGKAIDGALKREIAARGIEKAV